VGRRERWEQLELFPYARKVCSACGKAKLLAEFHRKRGARDGLQARCKPCNIGGAKKFHAENLDHCRRRIGAWIRRIRGGSRMVPRGHDAQSPLRLIVGAERLDIVPVGV